MNDHTQGGGVQVVNQVQFKVLLLSGCQGLRSQKNQRLVSKRIQGQVGQGIVSPGVVVFQERELLFEV